MKHIAISEYKPQTISIIIDATMDRVRKHFRCSVCGCIVFDYFGGLKLLVYGDFIDDGERDVQEVDWLEKLGVPTPIKCPGRFPAILPDGKVTKARCNTVYLKVGT